MLPLLRHAASHVFLDLGMSPLCESYLPESELDSMEPFYPLKAYVCESCLLVQLSEYVSGEAIFSEYAYFSSYSESWLKHAENYCKTMTERFGLGAHSRVVEVASNDGYLLQYFAAQGIPVLGIEPAANVARVAIDKGVPTRVTYLGRQSARALAAEGVSADLLVGNNVLAHVPDLNGFVEGLSILLGPRGVLTMEFPHLPRLVAENQFDTIYHEHFCYLSLLAVRKVFAARGLRVFDVEELRTHGGSLRIYACHADDPRPTSEHRRGGCRRGASGRLWQARHVSALRGASRGNQAEAVGIFDPGQASRQASGRLRRTGQRQHPAELLRHPHRFRRLHGRSESL